MRRRIAANRWRLVAALFLIVLGVVVYLRRPSSEEPAPASLERAGSRVVDVEVDVAARTARSYRITYEISTLTDAEATVTTDHVFVDRPFRSHVRSRPRTGGAEESVTINAFGRYSVGGTAFNIPPGAADADRRPDTVLPEAVEDGYAERRETRRVARRHCRVYRIAGGSELDSLPKLEDAGAHTDLCVDEDGLVLEEATFEGRELVRRRVARAVDVGAEMDDRAFELELAEDALVEQIGSVQTLEDDSRLPGKTFWQPSREPEGFTFEGRYAVIPPGQPGFTDITSRGSVQTFVSEVWTDGPDVVVIDQGSTQGAKPFEDDPHGRAIDGGELGKGQLLYSIRESSVRFLTGGVRFVRVRGTVPPSRLLEIARSLEGVDGGPLRVKD